MTEGERDRKTEITWVAESQEHFPSSQKGQSDCKVREEGKGGRGREERRGEESEMDKK